MISSNGLETIRSNCQVGMEAIVPTILGIGVQ
jgi:hypothetical protein